MCKLFLFLLCLAEASEFNAWDDSLKVDKKYRWNIQCGVNFSYFDGFIISTFRDKIVENNYLTSQYYSGYIHSSISFTNSIISIGDYAIIELPENQDIIQNQNPAKNGGFHLTFFYTFPSDKKIKYILGTQIMKRKREIYIVVNIPTYYPYPNSYITYFKTFPINIFTESKNFKMEKLDIKKLKANSFSFEIMNGIQFSFKKVNIITGINLQVLSYSNLNIIPQYENGFELRSKSYLNMNNFNSFIQSIINEFVQVEYLYAYKKFMLYPYFNTELYNHLRYAPSRTLFAWNYAFKFGVGFMF